MGEWAQGKTVAASGALGFNIANVLVEGREYTDADTLRAIINVRKGDPLFSLNPEEAKDMLEKVSWIKTAEVQRRLPDTVYIRLDERKPLALWQHNRKLSLIDGDGVVLTSRNLQKFSDLVIVTGEDAEHNAAPLMDYLNAEPSIRERVEAAAFISGRRWNIRLKDGKILKLPEDDIGFALRRLALLDEEEKLLERSILSVDLRERDRVSVQTTPGAVERYKAGYIKKDGAI